MPTNPTHRLSSIIPIILFSYLGVLIRLAFSFLGNSHSPLNATLWSNLFGCFIMGFVFEQKTHLQQDFAQLYVGLTTGLCGSITTYSGVMFYSCVALYGSSAQGTYPICNYLSVLIAVLSSSFVGYLCGRDLSAWLYSSDAMKRPILQIKDHCNQWLFPLLISTSTPLLILLAVLLPLGRWSYLIYSVIFAPFGALTRYLLSILFNGKYRLPVGTWLANNVGSLLYLGLVAIRTYRLNQSELSEQILIGLLQGYCGCLTTVSTLIMELQTIDKQIMRYAYLLATLVPLQVIYEALAGRFSSLCASA